MLQPGPEALKPRGGGGRVGVRRPAGTWDPLARIHGRDRAFSGEQMGLSTSSSLWIFL